MRLTNLLYSVVFLLLLLPTEVMAQQDTILKTSKVLSKKMSSATDELKESLSTNDESKIAKNYENVAQNFIKKGDNPKAEEYLKKALTSYTKLNNNTAISRVTRSLAKIQESQNKLKDASANYKMASEAAADKETEVLNKNDYNRVQASAPIVQRELIGSNISILEKENRKEELAEAYVQKAATSMQLNDKDDAIGNLNQAIVYAKESPKKVIEIKNEIAKVYASKNQFDEAIAINKNLLAEAENKKDFETQIRQMQSLATLYFKKNEPENAIKSLQNAYKLATQKGNSTEVKKSLSALLAYYKDHGKDKESIALYDDFFKNFEQLIQSDSTLIDAKLFQVTEDKIHQLEKEKSLKDELIAKKNAFNYFLIGAIGLLLIFFGLIAKALFSIKKKNKEIALQSLRREMNPHFIFNSLNSVNQFISQNKELEANKYLTNYSNLMRNMMENSNKDFVTISNEIEQLKKYLDLEHLRFQDKFDYKIEVDEALDTEAVFVPNMIIQPHLENAIWHGLRYRDEKGLLLLQFKLDNGKVVVIIDDNGIGLTKSNELKTQNQKVHQSRGLTNTKERIALLNDLYKKEISFQIIEKESPETGTIVTIDFPLIEKIG